MSKDDQFIDSVMDRIEEKPKKQQIAIGTAAGMYVPIQNWFVDGISWTHFRYTWWNIQYVMSYE